MSDIAIKVQNISKRYRIGLEEEVHDTLAGVVTDFVRSPLKNLRRLRRLTQFSENGGDPEDIIWVLKDVSFEVERGKVVGIIGANGAGKSTLLKILSRITHPTSGWVKLNGRVSSLLEVGTGFHPELTGRDNIYLNGTILGMTKTEVDRKFDEIVDFSGVEKFIDTPVKFYSSGMRVRLAFSVAAHLEPEILLVDEVLAVGDAGFQKKCLGKMGSVASEGRTVLFVSHQMAAVENLCKRVIHLDSGTIVQDGRSSMVITNYLQGLSDIHLVGSDLSKRTDRSGTGQVRITGFHLENGQGEQVSALKSGLDTIFVLTYKTDNSITISSQMSVGFYLYTHHTGQPISVLYNTYQGVMFETAPNMGEVRCIIPNFPFPPGRYLINARIALNGIEADWPMDAICTIDVHEGDFYGTGKKGPSEDVAVLLQGDWSHRSFDE